MSGETTIGEPESTLHYYREMANLTQEELAERAGVSVRSISNIERGIAHTPRLDTLRRLGEALQLTEEQLQRLRKAVRPGYNAHTKAPLSPPLTHAHLTTLSTLPIPVTPLIGREQETTAIANLLTQHSSRLLTITGAGGVGKTRLALQVAGLVRTSFADGATFVSLAPLHDPGPVIAVIAHALDIREEGDQSIENLLRAYLRDHELLFVLDNCEHLLPTIAPLLADLLASSPRLTLLATSRVALHLRGEHVYSLSPLCLPAADETSFAVIARSPAIQLFVERVRTLAVATIFTLNPSNVNTVAEICRRLDGLPLAIELAAARSAHFGPHMLLERLNKQLSFLTTGAYDLPQRQQTLRNTLAWSYDLLPPATQRVFRQLAVFAGGWTFQAANQVGNGDGNATDEVNEGVLDSLTTLVDHHLVRQVLPEEDDDDENALRFHMLETVREYAWERLHEDGEEDLAIERHGSYYATLAETAEPKLRGPDQIIWSRRLEHEQANLRVAIQRSLDKQKIIVALRLVTALTRFWLRRGYLSEGRGWLEQVLTLAGQHSTQISQLDQMVPDNQALQVPMAQMALIEFSSQQQPPEWLSLYAKALACKAVVATMQDDFPIAMACYDQSLKLLRALGNTRETAHVLNNCGECMRTQGNHARALLFYEESLALKIADGDLEGIPNSLNNIGLTQTELGNFEVAERTLLDCLVRVRTFHDPLRTARVLTNLGYVAIRRQRYTQAQQLLEESLALWRTLDDPISLAYTLGNLGDLYCDLGAYSQALALLREALQLYQQAGVRDGLADGLEHVAHVFCALGSFCAAIQLRSAAMVIREEICISRSPLVEADWRADLSRAHMKLGEEAYIQAWNEGRMLTLEAAIATANSDYSAAIKPIKHIAVALAGGRPDQTLPYPLAHVLSLRTLPLMA